MIESIPTILDNTTALDIPAVLLDYQKDWIGLRSPLKVGEKSRRIGLPKVAKTEAAASQVEKIAKKGGLDAATVAEIRREILGVAG